MPVTSDFFDLVFAYATLEHVPDICRAFRECWERVICPRYVADEMSETFVACSGGYGCVEHERYGRFM
jgi:hypothetical protein